MQKLVQKQEEYDKEFRKKIVQQQKEFDNWRNSIEGVLYNLSIGGNTMVDDRKYELIIAKTLLKLPKKVRNKILDESHFIITGGTLGTTGMIRKTAIIKTYPEKEIALPTATVEIRLIILNFSAMETGKMSESSMMDVVAHEIAHLILKHYGSSSDPKGERKTDDLVEKWGFKRAYKSYECFEKKG